MLITDDAALRPVGVETVYGALDLGTNNCRLLMAVPYGDGFQVVDAFSRMTRLGEGLAASGMLSSTAIERTIGALRFCSDKLVRRRTARIRAVATEACRRAANCRDFLSRVEGETGIALEIISSDEEAALALAGCAPLLDEMPQDGLVFDIGGGSTELIQVRQSEGEGREPEIVAIQSLPLGVVTLAEQRGEELHNPAGYERIVAEAMALFRRFDPSGALSGLAEDGKLQLLGTSGTVTTLGGVHLGLPRYDRALVDGLVMDFAAIEAISTHLVSADFEARAAMPCVGRGRADLVVAGCAILAAICRLWPGNRLKVADRGVREGILLSMMRADQATAGLRS